MKRFSSINTFFVEMIIVILFFSICSAVTVNFFADANKKAQKSSEINKAVILAQNTVEEFKSNTDIFKINKLYKTYSETDKFHLFEFWYDKDFNKTEDDSPTYIMKVQINKNDTNIITADISIYRANDELNLFSVKTGKFIDSVNHV